MGAKKKAAAPAKAAKKAAAKTEPAQQTGKGYIVVAANGQHLSMHTGRVVVATAHPPLRFETLADAEAACTEHAKTWGKLTAREL